MDATQVANMWFSPLNYILYLGIILVGFGVWQMIKWHKYTAEYVKLIVINPDASASVFYVKKEGSSVSIKNPKTGAVKMWPITDLSCFDQLYPGDVVIPKFMQKTIKTTLLSSTDWEPMVNLGENMTHIVSPDVKEQLMQVLEMIGDEKNKKLVAGYLEGLRTTGTKKIIASPSLLGNLMMEKITEAVMSVNKEMMDKFDMILKRIIKPANPIVVYIGLGFIILLQIYIIYSSGSTTGNQEVLDGVNAIKRSLGVP